MHVEITQDNVIGLLHALKKGGAVFSRINPFKLYCFGGDPTKMVDEVGSPFST